MRRLIISSLAVAALLIPAASASGVERHVHNLTTQSGNTHSIAGGVTSHAPCTAFLNVHNNVHLGVLAAPDNPNPNTVAVVFIGEFC
jgi:hypothetical protein